MLLNRVEKLLMNSPVRAATQRWIEAPLLARLAGPIAGAIAGARVLEIGCGGGVGTAIVRERFGAREVLAFDLDPDMVARARRRLAGTAGVALCVADATRIPARDGAFDAVFDFGILHHVPSWRDAIAEVAPVLRPGKAFFFEEVTRRALDRWIYRALFVHPTGDRFSPAELTDELARHGIEVGARRKERWFGDFFLGVGVKR